MHKTYLLLFTAMLAVTFSFNASAHRIKNTLSHDVTFQIDQEGATPKKVVSPGNCIGIEDTSTNYTLTEFMKVDGRNKILATSEKVCACPTGTYILQKSNNIITLKVVGHRLNCPNTQWFSPGSASGSCKCKKHH